MRKIFLATLTIIFLYAVTVNAAPPAKDFKPRLLMAEVETYGVTELKPEVAENFYIVLSKILSEDFNVESRKLVANIGGEPVSNTQIFSTIHMDAIARGPFHNYDTSDKNLKAYADSILGRQKRKTETKKYDGKAYRLNTSLASEIRKIGAAYDVDYLFFCNIRDVDAWRRIGAAYGANPTVKNLNGKKISVNLDYYLVDVKTGKVFTGQISDNKTKLASSQLAKIYGRNYTAENMMNYALRELSLKIQKNILDKGFKALNAK